MPFRILPPERRGRRPDPRHIPKFEETHAETGFERVRRKVGAHGRESWDRVQAIWKAIDDYAELETGNREYFWNRPHSIG